MKMFLVFIILTIALSALALGGLNAIRPTSFENKLEVAILAQPEQVWVVLNAPRFMKVWGNTSMELGLEEVAIDTVGGIEGAMITLLYGDDRTAWWQIVERARPKRMVIRTFSDVYEYADRTDNGVRDEIQIIASAATGGVTVKWQVRYEAHDFLNRLLHTLYLNHRLIKLRREYLSRISRIATS